MRKFGWLCISVCFLLLVTACGSGEDTSKEKADAPAKTEVKKETQTEKKDTKTTQKDTEKSTDETPKEEPKTEQISVNVGLGDTLEAYQKAYGTNEGDETIARFQNDYLLPMFADKRAINLTVQFESTNDPSRTMEEAKTVASAYIPKDATLTKEYVDGADMGMPRTVMEYHSDTLAPLFPDWEPAGTFVVIFNYGDNENDVFGITIGLGDNP